VVGTEADGRSSQPYQDCPGDGFSFSFFFRSTVWAFPSLDDPDPFSGLCYELLTNTSINLLMRAPLKRLAPGCPLLPVTGASSGPRAKTFFAAPQYPSSSPSENIVFPVSHIPRVRVPFMFFSAVYGQGGFCPPLSTSVYSPFFRAFALVLLSKCFPVAIRSRVHLAPTSSAPPFLSPFIPAFSARQRALHIHVFTLWGCPLRRKRYVSNKKFSKLFDSGFIFLPGFQVRLPPPFFRVSSGCFSSAVLQSERLGT